MDASAWLAVLRRRWLAIALCLAAGLAGSAAAIENTSPTYSATTRLFLNIPAARDTQEALLGVQLSHQLLASYARVATSLSAAARVKQELRLEDSNTTIQSRLSAEPVENTLLLNISATGSSPATAKRLADGAARVFIDQVESLERGSSLGVKPQVIDAAVRPTQPVRPRPRRDVALGGIIGLLAGAALTLLLESLDRSIRSPTEAASRSGAPILAVVPRRRDASQHPLLDSSDVGTRAAEAYRVLRTAVRFVDPERTARSLVITSPSAGEGKTSTAANLAVALAQAGERVIVVDADLRRSKLSAVFGEAPADLGLTSRLIGEGSLDELLLPIGDRLLFLPTGPLPPNPSELLGSEAMARLVRDLRSRCDVVVFDSPPLLPVTDAQVLSTQVDGVVVVARFGRTRRELLAESRSRLDVVGARVLGCVLNDVPGSAEYTEEYGYSSVVGPARGRRWTVPSLSRLKKSRAA